MGNAITAIFGADNSDFIAKQKQMDAATEQFAAKQKKHSAEQKAAFEAELTALDEKLQKQRQLKEEENKSWAASKKIQEYLSKKESIGMRSGRGMTDGFAEHLKRESVVLGKEGAVASTSWMANFTKGLQGHGSGGIAQLVHVMRASFDSLASGMSPWRVMLQQGPQALQAFTSMSGGLITKIFSVIKSPITAIVAGFALLGVAALKVVDWFNYLARAEANLAAMTNLSNQSFVDHAQVIADANKEHQDGVDWVNRHADAQARLKDSLDETIKSMRAQAEFERDIAKLHGASKVRLTQMEIDAEKEELKVMQASRDASEEKHHQDFLAQQQAQKNLDAFNTGSGDNSRSRMAEAKRKADEAAKLVDAATAAMHTSRVGSGKFQTMMVGNIPQQVEIDRAANEHDKVQFTVDGKEYNQSVSATRDAYSSNNSEYVRLESLKKELDDMIKKKETMSDADLEIYNRKKGEAKDLEDKIKLDEKYKLTMARLEENGAGMGFSLNSQQKIGAYAATPPDMKRLVEAAIRTAHNTEHLKPQTNAPPSFKPAFPMGGKK